ncbi:hypothetical protein Caci_6925 [Catenulispora acidiphila DSM 44928]|uniref:Uncharacterized protein n=1 Tax=Catenulispora acidiphila (strain DSM 44928 / JCM 14897 / NBRC 102108 / NRRL B-24433 / ID139908) TaxID=479433 RepID=C7Q3J3_CATAD|nr:S-4TM family putative pore-forming effector [Catenulispora acidiphila]ACU75758.1 hypothetical protein Caci_6925 [Catenulispora acidiphila DSM 44928]
MTGPHRPVPVGAGADIRTRQDEIEHLRRLRAYSHMYNSAQMWRRLRAAGTLALALIAPVVAVFVPSSTDTLAAVGAGWLVIGRTVLTRLEQHARGDAVRAHELYDTKLFHLPWNQSLAGSPPSPDDIVRAAERVPDHERYHDWYSIDLTGVAWPGDVLLCQRQSMVWSRSDHRAYGNAVLAAGLGWFTAGLVLAVVKDLSLSDYLIKIFLPCAPAFLDTSELAHEHRQHSIAREQTENDIRELWNTYRLAPDNLPVGETRRIQDSAFQLRRTGPRVPTFYYRLRRSSSQHATVTATAELICPENSP